MDATMQYVPIMVVGFATALGLTPLSRQIAMRLGIIDRPKKRNITRAPTPMMGGLAIYVSFALPLLLFSPAEQMGDLIAIIGGAAFLALVGLVDDRYELGIRVKLAAMIAAACALIAAGIHIQLFDAPLLDYPVTILWVLTITNATNFLDNMDGLTAGLSAISAGFFLLLALGEGLPLVSGLSAALLGSALGFLSYNFSPASSFMGDMGSLVLGFTLSALGIILEFGSQPLSVTWMVPILVLAVQVFDIHLVVLTRLLEGRSPGEGGKDHTSHRLMSIGFSQRMTLFILYGASVSFGTMGLLMAHLDAAVAWRIGLFSIVLLGVLFGLMMWARRVYQLNSAG